MGIDDRVSLCQLAEAFLDAEAGREYFEDLRWGGHVHCAHCCCDGRITARKGRRAGYYHCGDCLGEFTVRTGTVMERSHIPLHKWAYAMCIVVTARKGVSSVFLANTLGVTQKSAWFMLSRLREACGQDGGGCRDEDGFELDSRDVAQGLARTPRPLLPRGCFQSQRRQRQEAGMEQYADDRRADVQEPHSVQAASRRMKRKAPGVLDDFARRILRHRTGRKDEEEGPVIVSIADAPLHVPGLEKPKGRSREADARKQEAPVWSPGT